MLLLIGAVVIVIPAMSFSMPESFVAPLAVVSIAVVAVDVVVVIFVIAVAAVVVAMVPVTLVVGVVVHVAILTVVVVVVVGHAYPSVRQQYSRFSCNQSLRGWSSLQLYAKPGHEKR